MIGPVSPKHMSEQQQKYLGLRQRIAAGARRAQGSGAAFVLRRPEWDPWLTLFPEHYHCAPNSNSLPRKQEACEGEELELTSAVCQSPSLACSAALPEVKHKLALSV